MYSEKSLSSRQRWTATAANLRSAAIVELSNNWTPVEFTTGNTKLGDLAAVGTLPGIDCGAGCRDCFASCYATRGQYAMNVNKIAKMARNSARLAVDPVRFFNNVAAYVELNNLAAFRLWESGDCCSLKHFNLVVDLCRRCPGCIFLMYSKHTEIITAFLAAGGELPENLQLLESGGYNLPAISAGRPSTIVDFSGADIPEKYRRPFVAPEGQTLHHCKGIAGGGCTGCAIRGINCFDKSLTANDTIVFAAH